MNHGHFYDSITPMLVPPKQGQFEVEIVDVITKLNGEAPDPDVLSLLSQINIVHGVPLYSTEPQLQYAAHFVSVARRFLSRGG